MTPLLKKLNFREQKMILVLNSPDSFEQELTELKKSTAVLTENDSFTQIDFVICFVTTKHGIIRSLDFFYNRLNGDAVLWFCYPKGSSKKYKCEFNRDTGWEDLGKLNLEPVRQVSIDEDWSALRFRRVEYIKKITRRESFALTLDAKKRTSKKGE